MARQGFDGATIADIARAAGLTPGLVHYHFQNKLEILTALVDQLASRHAERLRCALAAAGDDPTRRLAAFIDLHLDIESAQPEAVAVWTALAGEALRAPAVRLAFRRGLESARAPLVAIIEAGVADARFTTPDPSAAAAALLALTQGYLVLAATTDEIIPRGSAAGAARAAAAGLLGLTELPALSASRS